MTRTIFATVVLAIIATPAAAQIAAEADCVVAAQERQVRRLLATVPTGADDIDQTERVLARADNCPTQALRRQTNGRFQLEMRGALAEALVRRDHWPLPATLPPAGAARGGLAALTARDLEASGAIPRAIDAHVFASCLVRSDWPGVAAVLQTRPSTPAELEAIMAMKPRFAACLDPTAKFAMRANFLRAALAEESLRALDPPAASTASR